ncbi:MAG: DUF4326 domain-containing protein [Pseudolabrys sp.]
MPKVLNKYKAGVPHGAVYCGRGSPYGNPFVIGRDGDRDQVCEALSARCCRPWTCPALRGKDLVCFCAPAGHWSRNSLPRWNVR